MEMFLFLIGLIFGGLISWEFTHAYYKESSKAQNTVFSKLSEEARYAIIEDNRENLSILELSELIREKMTEKKIGEEAPYMLCPECGSEEFDRTSDSEIDYDSEQVEFSRHYDVFRCKKCGYTSYSQMNEISPQ